MEVVSANKTGLVFAVALGGWHTLWAVVVAFGWAQAVINFVFWMHFIKPIYMIGDFKLSTAVILVAVTAVFGYVMGYILAALWNWVHR